MEDNDLENSTQITLHSVSNILGNTQQTSLFSEHDHEFSEEYGTKLVGTINRFGVDLTDMQSRIMEGILRGFSETAYKGNMSPRHPQDVANEKFNGNIPDGYKYIKEIPRLRVSQSQILEWSGLKGGGISSWARSLKALHDLGTTQFCFYYDRLAYDEVGVPIKKGNAWKKEEVVVVDTLFTIKEIRDEKRVDYYEITPSSIFLDQRESYFMMVPFNWREEVKKLLGNKKISSYTFRFLLFLRFQYEIKRRSKRVLSPYKIKWSPEEISEAIKMPASIYLRKKKRRDEILDDAYSVAKSLGYLKDFKRDGYLDHLILNDAKYYGYKEKNEIEKKKSFSESYHPKRPDALLILEHFDKCRSELDPSYQSKTGSLREKQISIFQHLLSERKESDIKDLISWSITNKYWFSKLSDPILIRKNFSEAWSTFSLSKRESPEYRASENRDYASQLLKTISSKPQNLSIHQLNKYLEFSFDGTAQCHTISYEINDFKNALISAFKKFRVEIEGEN